MAVFYDLLDFVQNRMRMSHIYQPVMLMTLLKNGGKASVNRIARQFAMRDEALIEYYAKITKDMPGRVLGKNHGIVSVIKGDKNCIAGYQLNGFAYLTNEENKLLIEACQQKYEDYLDARGHQVYKHRRRASGYISGTLKYEVLKRARYRCELCGVLDTEAFLEVDHIQPRSLGGSDDLSNLQALCYKCNSWKSNKDSVDLRGNRTLYETRESGCLFCSPNKGHQFLREAELAYVIKQSTPVTKGHVLIIPKRHEASWFELTQGELAQCNLLIKEMKETILAEEKDVLGFNMGVNSGTVAGQTIMHSHVHLIPRRENDGNISIGEIKGVMPDQHSY